ncbi:hypothetical protein ACFOGI_10595 [Virgibacillus xinjiangensis]|uniref:Uncharacterized protein n=1 Tax=Virgibacillus xinjiangensis TaxID=393090 RepID=A0ABV7CWF4_9BACI
MEKGVDFLNWYIVWIVFFIVAILGVGIHYSRKIKTADDYMKKDIGWIHLCHLIDPPRTRK